MIDSLGILDLIHAAILGPEGDLVPPRYVTDAKGAVFKPGDWPTQEGQYPILKLRLVSEHRRSLGPHGPAEFETTATIRISGEVSAPAQVDNLGAADAEARLWRLKRQVDAAVVNSYPLTQAIQQISAMRAQLAYNSEAATHLAGIQIDVAVEFYEGPENFAPLPADDLNAVHLDANHYPPTGFTAPLPA